MSRKFNPRRKHAETRDVAIWAAWIAGICAIAAAIIGAVLAYELPNTSTASTVAPVTSVTATASAGPDLKVEEVEIALAGNIDASGETPPYREGPPMRYKATGPAIDITLRNSGNAPALIVNAVFSFTRATELSSCPLEGGDLLTSADYDVKVPIVKPASANNPFVLHRDMRFTVNANSIDRFRISVGPEQYHSTAWPWIYEFNLSLVEDNGKKLDLGPMSILGFSTGSVWDPLHGLTQTQLVINQLLPCVAGDAAELSHALANPGLHSPELQMMYQQAERLTTDAPSCRQIPISQNPNGCPAPGGKGAILSDPVDGVTMCGDTVEVEGGYPCAVADAIAKEYEEAKAPKVVQMTFKPDNGQPVPMQCLPAGRAEVCREDDGLTAGLVVGFIP
jgi:hypothetical protein